MKIVDLRYTARETIRDSNEVLYKGLTINITINNRNIFLYTNILNAMTISDIFRISNELRNSTTWNI